MRIGVDLDNTLICYDALFHAAALERGLIAPETPARKKAVKDAIQSAHGDPVWTKLQAEVYGPLLPRAEAFPGAAAFFRRCRVEKIELRIVSHKSRYPALGLRTDLREAAIRWLASRGWFDSANGLVREAVEFHDTRDEKVRAIARHRCDAFIDDLPEIFAEKNFPAQTTAILFDPDQAHENTGGVLRLKSWVEIEEHFFATAKKT